MPLEINDRQACCPAPAPESLNFLRLANLSRPGAAHGFFNRHGGVSASPFASLNTSFGVGDRPAAVRENRLALKQALGFTTLISARQVHGNRVLVFNGQPAGDFEAEGYDGLVTDQPVGLMIQQADCQAVLFFDQIRRVVGAAHVGWRGNVAGIIGATVRAMSDNFGTDPANLQAAISPSLGPCCGEFVNYHRELPAWMHSYQVRPDYFDFWAISRSQLEEAGLLPGQISASEICTRCNPDYFSYRRSGITGRSASAIGLIIK